MIEFALTSKEKKVKPSCGKGYPVLVTDPMYEEIIDDLIKAGNILTKCKHGEGSVCTLCKQTWEGVVSNANTVRTGKAVMKGKKK